MNDANCYTLYKRYCRDESMIYARSIDRTAHTEPVIERAVASRKLAGAQQSSTGTIAVKVIRSVAPF